MAKITIENTRESDITIAGMNENGDLVQVSIPAARQNPDNRSEIINGSAEADDEFVAALVKKSKVVDYYFNQGWLFIANKLTGADKKSAAKAV